MTLTQEAHVERVFHAALAPAARTAYLAQAYAADPVIQSAVERLLNCHDRAAARLAILGGAAAATGRLGRYRVLALLGQGGMGEVDRVLDTRLDREVGLKLLPAAFAKDADCLLPQEMPGTEKVWKAVLVLLALGLVGPEPDGLLGQLEVKLDAHGNVTIDEHCQTNVPKIYAAGAMSRSPALVVWAIADRQKAARSDDLHLMGEMLLPVTATAGSEKRNALDLNPNSADVHHKYAHHLIHLGRTERAIAEIRKAEELDPTDGFIATNVSPVLFFARRYDEAIEQARRAIELNPDSGPMYNWIIRAYEMKGDEQAAFAAILRRAEGNGVGADDIAGLKAAVAAGGLKDYWRRQLDHLLGRKKSRYVAQYSIALNYARLGEKEQALMQLQRAIEDRNYYLTALNAEPLWDSYRADPRFVALVRRVGLEP
jgi:tetratricopeptide (TPR) repeat protein